MKKLFIVCVLLTGFAQAEEYTPVDYKITKLPSEDWGPSAPVVKEEKWDSNYRIQETPEAERALASEKEEQSRTPSSDWKVKPKMEKKAPVKAPAPQAWPYQAD